MSAHACIAVYGAYGHTGRFVVRELQRRGFEVLACGRDGERLEVLRARDPSLRIASPAIDDEASLSQALRGCAAVVNCAGPFLDTAAPLIEAALRARIHYLDVCAEQTATADAFARYDAAARDADVVLLPAFAFYGGLADLLASAAMHGWDRADDIAIGVALDSWHPTEGTRRTGRRNTAPRWIIANREPALLPNPAPQRSWRFPAPFGELPMVGLPLSEIVTISHHLRADSVTSWMNLAPLRDLRDATTPAPIAVDADGRSAQQFALMVEARRGGERRAALARGRDIYAITAPLMAEAVQRVLDGRCSDVGALAAGEAFDARDFLEALAPEPLDWSMHEDDAIPDVS